jgi:hypothetical protein
MNSAKPPPPPPHRPGTSRPPPPPPLRTSKPPAVPSASPGTSQAHATAIDARAQAAPHEPAHARGAANEGAQAPAGSVAPAPHAGSVAPAPPSVVGAQPGQETRLRVSVKLSVRDPNLLLARPLGEGEAPPPGTRAAVLVLVEPAAEPEPRSGGSST